MTTNRRATPPSEVTLVYRELGKTHVFTAQELKGLHIGSSSLQTAFEQAIIALGEHVSRVFGCDAEYEAELSYDDFQRHLRADSASPLSGNFVIAKRAEINRNSGETATLA